MDISKLTHGAKLVLGGTILFLIVSFFSWFSYAGNGIWNMWHGIGVLAGQGQIVHRAQHRQTAVLAQCRDQLEHLLLAADVE